MNILDYNLTSEHFIINPIDAARSENGMTLLFSMVHVAASCAHQLKNSPLTSPPGQPGEYQRARRVLAPTGTSAGG